MAEILMPTKIEYRNSRGVDAGDARPPGAAMREEMTTRSAHLFSKRENAAALAFEIGVALGAGTLIAIIAR